MRVLGVLGYYPPRARIGAFLASHRLLARLVERGHTVQVRTFAQYDPFELDGVEVDRVGSDAWELAEKADVILSHYGDNGRAARTAEKLGKPDVRMVHGAPSTGTFGARPALAVFSSHAQRSLFDYDGPSIVAHPYTPPVNVAPGDRITIVGLSYEKGGGMFDRLSRCLPDRRFLAVRGGYGIQMNVSRPNVETINTVEDIADVLARTRVLLFPSQSETWGMVGVEALSAGIPVIASDLPALRESLGDAALFVRHDDPQGWHDALLSLDDPDEWQRRSRAARARFAALEDHRDRFAEAVEALCC